MLRKMGRFRPGKIDGGGGGCSHAIVAGAFGLLPLFSALVWGVMLCSAPRARADPVPVVENGLPPTAIPTYRERGAPNFSYPAGGTNAGQGGSGGGNGSGESGNGGGGGYSGSGGGGSGIIARGYSQYEGQSVGSGECVALVQATSGVGQTSTWAPGRQVQGSTDIPVGTVIATFGENGTYTNTYGRSHAAIYLGQNDQGIQVMDQWLNQPATVRTIGWTTRNPYESGSRFYVVSR